MSTNSYTTHELSIGPMETAPRLSSFPRAGQQYVYIRSILANELTGFTYRGVPVSIPLRAFFADPLPAIVRILSEFAGQSEPPPSLVRSFGNLAQIVHGNVAGNSSLSRAPVVPLVLRIDVRRLSSVEDEGDDEDRALLEAVGELSLSEDRGVQPADESAIEALEEAAERAREFQDLGRCSICLEEFGGPTLEDHDHDGDDGDDKTVRMPCSHVYHRKCIVAWLKRSHLCPLCRYAMPTATTSSAR